MIFNIPAINYEDIPKEYCDLLELPINGGNVVSVDLESDFGKWLQSKGTLFDRPSYLIVKTWVWLAIFR